MAMAQYEREATIFDVELENLEVMDPQASQSTPGSGTSERSKIHFFALQRAIERYRPFYYVLQVAMATLISGIFLSVLTEILWQVIPAGRQVEIIISSFSALGWFLMSTTVGIMSTCPVDELDFNMFVQARPILCLFLAILPLTTAVTRVWELPLPRWISCGVSAAMLLSALLHQPSCPQGRAYAPSFGVLMEVWYLDVILATTVNELALPEPFSATDVWLGLHACLALLLQGWLWAKRVRSTTRFYTTSYMAITWNSSYFACRAIDLALGLKQWEEGRQLDVAIGAATTIAVIVLLPLLLVLSVGRKRLFERLSRWVDQSRRMQDGAFMAMLLDSYLVEVGQPWWLPDAEARAAEASQNLRDRFTVTKSSTQRSGVSLPDEERKRPGFVKAQVVGVALDGRSFCVELPDGRACEVHRQQQVLPWPQLLEQGRKKLRCVDWASQTVELWRKSTGAGYELSRPLGRGEVIDYFVSHSWSDSGEQKWKALELVAQNFHAQHGRWPTFWVDKICIDQRQIADGLRVLPVNVMACRQVLVLCGPTYPTRLWCAWELCVLLSFMPVRDALAQLVVIPLSHPALAKLTAFDCEISSCFDPNEELRLRHVIDAIGCELFETKIRQLGQLILDRELTKSRGLLVDAVMGMEEVEDGEKEEKEKEEDETLKEVGVELEPSEGELISI